MAKVGLVTTFRFAPCEDGASMERCWSVLSSFLLFHLAKGVDHIFLFADADDSSNDIFIERVSQEFLSSQVSIDVRDQAQRERQRANCRLWAKLGSFSATEVPARQSLNAEEALGKAAAMGLDWLIHLDIDELFYTSETSIKPHFNRLSQLGVEQMTYTNHEAVPTVEDVDDYFAEVELFRINHLMLPLSHEVGESTRFWRERRGHGQYMLAYDNGKAAVRVLPGRIVPQSVHRWRTLTVEERKAQVDQNPGDVAMTAVDMLLREPVTDEKCENIDRSGGGKGGSEREIGVVSRAFQGNQEPGSRSTSLGDGDVNGGEVERDVPLVNRSAMADPRELHFDEVVECEDPCVLHYPSCGLGWLRDKYRMLGRFPSSWFNGKLPIAPCFHLDARNAMSETDAEPAEGSERGNNDEDGGKGLYRKEVMLCPDEHAEEIRVQLKHGVLRTITGAASFIKQVRKARDAMGSTDVPRLVTVVGGQTQEDVPSSMAPDESKHKMAVSSPSNCSSTLVAAAALATQPGADVAKTLRVGGIPADPDASTGFENSWILAAVAREYL